MFFATDYSERAVLRDGTVVVLRLVGPADKALLRAGFDRLSAQSRYARFLAPKTVLTDDELAYFTELDQVAHFALGAVTEDGARGLGIARFIRLPGRRGAPATAEAAIAVADEAHGHGLGKLLFLRLCAAAAERGIATFRCELLGSNRDMRRLIERVSPEVEVEVGGGVMSIEMPLPEVPPTAPVEGPPPDSAMYRLFRAAAENAIEWTAAVLRLWRGEPTAAPDPGGSVHLVTPNDDDVL